MATGNTLMVWSPAANQPPAANFAVIDTTNSQLFLGFNDTTIQSALFVGVMPRNYTFLGLKVTVYWAAASATSGDVKWGGYFERLQDGIDLITADRFAAEQTVVSTAPGVAGTIKYATITFTDGAQIDSIQVGEAFRFKLRRVASDAADTMTGDGRTVRVEIRET